MVFGWFFGDPYKNMKKKLEALAVFEALELKDLDKQKVKDARKHEEEMREILNSLILYYEQKWRKHFFEANTKQTLVLDSYIYMIKDSIDNLPSFKDMHALFEEGLEAGGFEKELASIQSSLKIIKENTEKANEIVERFREMLEEKKWEKEEEKGEAGKKAKTSLFPLKPLNKGYSKTFDAKRSKNYSDRKEDISAAMKKLEEEVDTYVDTLHEKLKRGKYQKCWHARVPGSHNLRIIYCFNPATRAILYIDILTKNELDGTFKEKSLKLCEV